MCLLLRATTTIFAAAAAITQHDIKKIIALSTTSQLGLIMTILGLNQPALAFLHITIHSFFKALLFLCSGSFIHNLNNEQDIRIMGALTTTLIATILSAAYSIQIILLVLAGPTHTTTNPHKEAKNTIIPLIHLTITSILIGSLTKLSTIQTPPITTIPKIIKLIAMAITILGIVISKDLIQITQPLPPKKTQTITLFFNQLAFFNMPHRAITINTLKSSQQISTELIDL
ncbi:NADH-ubiquinone oxidoreductase chain 5 [Crotalus adamanteus]|uniref:NADH-ubiquinone oxidoreductase chain 5 n=1 Tax=Crotalus adamanteus TaxID=8729 RepID=A0AAW1B126_CROAD